MNSEQVFETYSVLLVFKNGLCKNVIFICIIIIKIIISNFLIFLIFVINYKITFIENLSCILNRSFENSCHDANDETAINCFVQKLERSHERYEESLFAFIVFCRFFLRGSLPFNKTRYQILWKHFGMFCVNL